MSDKTGIEWADATWNPLVGCTKVSAGCDNCYALGEVNRRHAAALSPKTSPRMLEAFPARFDVVSMRPDRFLTQPLRWSKPRRVFVNSLSDLFHADVPDDFIARVFAVMAAAQQHTFQLLTKRHGRMRSLLSDPWFRRTVEEFAAEIADGMPDGRVAFGWPLPNVWLGVSVEDQRWADIRIPALLNTPAAVRWISAEPLLGPVDLADHLDETERDRTLDWVVVGGESGQGARPMHPQWARDLRDQCAAAAVPFLFKQWGNWAPAEIGLRGKVREVCVSVDGECFDVADWVVCVPNESDGKWMQHVGKHAAGRHLDGRVHDGSPTPVGQL